MKQHYVVPLGLIASLGRDVVQYTAILEIGSWGRLEYLLVLWCWRTGPLATMYVEREKETSFYLSLLLVGAYGCVLPFVNMLCIFLVSKILFKKSDVLSMQFW